MTSDPVERYLLRASKIGRRARLRPMQLAEQFDLSLRVYRMLGWRILVASAVPTLFTLAGLAFLFQYVLPNFAFTEQGTKQVGQVTEAGINLLLGVVVAGPLILIGVSLATTYISPLVADFMHGLTPNYKAAAQAQWKSGPRMLLASVRESLLAACGAIIGAGLLFLSWFMSNVTRNDDATAGVVLVLGMCALGVGAVLALFVVSAHALVAPVTAIEKLGPQVAARRSRDLLRARPFHGSGYDAVWSLYLLLGLLVGILLIGAEALSSVVGASNWIASLNLRAFRPIVEGAIDLAPYYVTLWVIVPVWAVTVTIIYFERRVRLEGYDIEALASDVWDPHSEDPVRS